MRKVDVQMHSDRFGPGHPAINVKCYNFGPSSDAVMLRFGCSRAEAEAALTFAWESACENFWAVVGDDVAEIFPGAKCYSEGRLSGWLVVHGLPDVESWDAVMLGKWAKLARIVRKSIQYRASDDAVFCDIEANEWHKPGAEKYNFVESADGPKCVADLKQAAIAAGFAAVVR